MNSFQLKLLAASLMLVDHIGFVFFPHYSILRILGRLSFPIFSWQLINGWNYTSNKLKYFLGMLLFGVISQPLYMFLFQLRKITNINILIVFTLSLVFFYFWEKIGIKSLSKVLQMLILSFFSLFFVWFFGVNLSYTFLIIFLFYIFFNDFKAIFITNLVLNLFFFSSNFFFAYQRGFFISNLDYLQIFSVFSLVFIFFYNQKQGLKVKYFFYFFYPLHLLFLLLFRLFLGSYA